MFSILHIPYRGRIMMKRDRPERLFVDVLVSMFSSGFSIVPRIILSLSLPRYRSSMRKYRDEIVDIDIQCVSSNTWRTFGVQVSSSRSFSRWFSTLLSYIRNLLEYSCLRFEICSIIQQECEKGMFEDIIAPLDGYENSGFDNIEPRTNFIRDFGIRNSRTSSVRSYDEEDWIWASVLRQCSTFQWKSNATSVHLLLRFKHYGDSWILQHKKYSNAYS